MPDAQLFEATAEEYHRMPDVSSSWLKEFDADPQRFHHELLIGDWPRAKPTPAQEFGTAVHYLVEHGCDWESMTVEIPQTVLNRDGHCKGKKYTDWRSDHVDKVAIKTGSLNPYQVIAANLRSHTAAWGLLSGEGHFECNIRWTDAKTNLDCRARLDRVRLGTSLPKVIVDLKTCTNVDYRNLQRDIEAWGYYRQLAWYRQAWYELTGDLLPCAILAVANKPSYRVEVIQLAETWLERGWWELCEVMDRFAYALQHDQWWPPSHGQIVKLGEPAWAAGKEQQYHISGGNHV